MKRILIAEDEDMLSLIIKDALEIKNYEVVVAKNGAEALAIIPQFKPHLLILDIMMPNMNGYELANQIRKTDAALPIIFLSAKSQTADVLKGFQSGANDYVKKPFSIDELLARVGVLLKNYSANPMTEDRSNEIVSYNDSQNVQQEDTYVFMKNGSKLIKVDFDDISYLEAEKDYTTLFRQGNKTLISAHLKELEDLLPKDKFIRVHRSYIVSIKAISSIKSGIIEIDHQEIPIGSNYKENVYKALRIS